MVDSKYYMTILAQTFSPSGELLCAGNTFGKLAIIGRNKLVLEDDNGEYCEEKRGMSYSFRAHERSIQGLAATHTHLLSADTKIHGWSWDALRSQTKTPDFTITLPQQQFDCAEVNALCVDDASSHVLAGCGDNKVYLFDLQTGQLINTYEGHQDYVLALALRNKTFVSGSEDGCVCIWDVRQKKHVNQLNPSKHSELQRPLFGKWIGCVDINDDWLVCGGGPRLSLWHFNSMSLSATLPPDEIALNYAKIMDDGVIAGGNKPLLYHMDLSGDVLAHIPTSAAEIYSVAFHDTPEQIMTIGGSSWKLDVCTSLKYKDHDIIFPD